MSTLTDIHVAFRGLRRAPGFAAIAGLTLALGIGANVAVYTLLDRVLLRPLPYAEPEQLGLLFQDGRERGIPSARLAVPELTFVEWRRQNRSFERLEAAVNSSLTLSDLEQPLAPLTQRVTTGYFELLGVQPLLGRGFRPGDDEPGADRIVVLSNALWEGAFGGDEEIVGRKVHLDEEEYEVVGVLERSFFSAHLFDVQPDLFVPLRVDEAAPMARPNPYVVYGRLRGGVTWAEARADLELITQRLAEEHPRTHRDLHASPVPIGEDVVSDFRRTFLLVFFAVGAVLLVTCANVAGLQLARGLGRRGELAIRAALGATNRRLVRQLVVESAVLAALGTALGLVLGWAALGPLARLIPEQAGVPFLDDVSIDASVVGYAIIVAVLSVLLFGLLPARRTAGLSLGDRLRASRRGGAGHDTQRLREALIAGEVALAAVLLIGAGLLVQSFANLRGYDPGYAASEVLSLRNSLRGDAFALPESRIAHFERAVEALGRLPGVESVSAVNFAPPLAGFANVPYDRPDRPFEEGSEPVAIRRQVMPDYFATMGIPLRTGRGIERRDGAEAPPVAVINERLAEAAFPGEDPIGRFLAVRGEPAPREIVGVVGNVRSAAPDPSPRAAFYIPYAQSPAPIMNLMVRTGTDPMRLARAAEQTLWAMSRSMNVYQVESLADRLDDQHWRWRFAAQVLVAFAVFALFLGAVGLYSVISYAVRARRRELAIRIASGALPGEIVTLVLRAALRPAGAGMIVGVGLSLLLVRFLDAFLFGIGMSDPRTVLVVAAVLCATALIAAAVPAWRAAKVDPVVSLRVE